MQKYIQGFIDEFYEKLMKEMLKKIKEEPQQGQIVEEDDEDLQKAEDALRTWKAHMDNYFFNRFNPKKKQKVIKKNQRLIHVQKTQKVVISQNPQELKEVENIESKVLPQQETNIKQNPKLEQKIEYNDSQNQQSDYSDESDYSDDNNGKNKLSSITLDSTIANTSVLKQEEPYQNNLFGSPSATSLFSNQPVQNPFSFNLFKNPGDNQQRAPYLNLFASEYSNQSSFYGNANQSLNTSQISNSSLFQKPKTLFGNPTPNLIFGPSSQNSQKNAPSQNISSSPSLFPNSNQNSLFGPLFGNFTKVKKENPIQKQEQKVNFEDQKKSLNNIDKLIQKQQSLNSSPTSVIQNKNNQNKAQDQGELENDQSIFVSVQDKSQDQQELKIDFTVLHQMNVGLFIVLTLTPQKIQFYQETISQYYPSNYFHVGPRYDILNFFHKLEKVIQQKECSAHQINAALVQVGKKVIDYMSFDRLTSMKQISNQYYSSNYFHVGPRRTMFGYLQRIISIARGQ